MAKQVKEKTAAEIQQSIAILKEEVKEGMKYFIGLNFVLKRHFGNGDLPMYREIHSIKEVVFINKTDLMFLSDTITITDNKGNISIVTETKHVASEVYLEENCTEISNKYYDELHTYYTMTVKSMFRFMDELIADQLSKTHKLNRILNPKKYVSK